MTVAPVEHQAALLTHADRCDKCSGRAYVLAIIVWSPTFRGDGQLYFCGHHYAQHEQALRPMTAVLIDERWQLKEHVKDDKGNR